ncbi:hypothetical protein KA068_00470 [Candidatus Saccharibacteria bacterium]|jgi:hypothetical protein|nr:hypothetical protein [Candidatus Saccharibacteria bacterium]
MSTKIDNWLETMVKGWEGCDVDMALSVFAENVEYWESPYSLVNPNDLRRLWQSIKVDKNTKVSVSVFCSCEDSYAVQWRATWAGEDRTRQQKSGVYLVRLNSEGKCDYFYRTTSELEVVDE